MNKLVRMHREFLELNGELFEIIRAIKESNNPNVEAWKEVTGTDKVFRKDGRLYFCVKVEEAEVLEWIEDKNVEA